jgi:hypothetical protein
MPDALDCLRHSLEEMDLSNPNLRLTLDLFLAVSNPPPVTHNASPLPQPGDTTSMDASMATASSDLNVDSLATENGSVNVSSSLTSTDGHNPAGTTICAVTLPDTFSQSVQPPTMLMPSSLQPPATLMSILQVPTTLTSSSPQSFMTPSLSSRIDVNLGQKFKLFVNFNSTIDVQHRAYNTRFRNPLSKHKRRFKLIALG